MTYAWRRDYRDFNERSSANVRRSYIEASSSLGCGYLCACTYCELDQNTLGAISRSIGTSQSSDSIIEKAECQNAMGGFVCNPENWFGMSRSRLLHHRHSHYDFRKEGSWPIVMACPSRVVQTGLRTIQINYNHFPQLPQLPTIPIVPSPYHTDLVNSRFFTITPPIIGVGINHASRN